MDWLKEYSVVLIPILTVVLSVLVGFIKEKFIDSEKIKRSLQEKQLLELYNKVFIIYLKYNKELSISWVEEDEVFHEGEFVSIRKLDFNPEVWNEVTKKLTDIVYEKIHLLEYNDLSLWHEVEYLFYEIDSQDDLYDAYNGLKLFIKSAVNTYGKLYHGYHMATRKRRRMRKKEIKKKIKSAKKNHFYSKEERSKVILELQRQLKNLEQKHP